MDRIVEMWWVEYGKRFRNEMVGNYVMQGHCIEVAIEKATIDVAEKFHAWNVANEKACQVPPLEKP